MHWISSRAEVADETGILFVPLNMSVLDAIPTLSGTMLRIRIFAKSLFCFASYLKF